MLLVAHVGGRDSSKPVSPREQRLRDHHPFAVVLNGPAVPAHKVVFRLLGHLQPFPLPSQPWLILRSRPNSPT